MAASSGRTTRGPSQGAAVRSGVSPNDAAFDLPLEFAPMEARTARALPDGPGWQYEPKWDGFRCLAHKVDNRVDLRAKSGKPLGRYFPEVVEQVRRLRAAHCVLDGELIVETEPAIGFEALQMRLHPAQSRIDRLSRETPATLMVFDLLVEADGTQLCEQPLLERRRRLEQLLTSAPPGLTLSPATLDRGVAERWLAEAGRGRFDGVVAKRCRSPYLSGERRMVKVKPARTADCVVGGFRYDRAGTLVASLLLGLYDTEGRLNHVGFTSSIKAAEKPALTRLLEELRQPPGFTGRAPGGPSRWATERSEQWVPLRPELVVEVAFDQVGDGRFRHGTQRVRWRPDKAPRQCGMEQILAPDPIKP